MAYTNTFIKAESTGTNYWITAQIWLYYDYDDPSNAPYASLSYPYIYAKTQSALNRVPNGTTISVGGSSFDLSAASWSNVIYDSSKSAYYRYLPTSSVPHLTLNISPGDSFYCRVRIRDSLHGTYDVECNGTLYFPQRVIITPPATVTLNAVNYFTCTQFTLPDNAALYASGSGYLKPSYKSAPCYLDATTKLDSTNARGRTISSFSWYPSYKLAQSGDFSGGVGEYYMSLSASYDLKWYGSSSYQVGGLRLSSLIVFPSLSGPIYYNETPPAAAAPLVTLTATEVSGAGLYAQYGKYIKGMSQVRYTAAVTYRYGAVKSYFELVVGYNYTTALTYTFWPEAAGTATAHAEDDHDAETEVSVNYDVYDYWTPALTAAIHRCTQNGTRDDNGSYCLIEWAINVAPLGNQNSKSLTITHPAGTSTPTLSSYTASGSLIVAADPELSYDIGFSLTDDFTTVTRTMKLSTAGVIMDIYRGGHGIAFGKVAENDYTLEVTSEWDVLLNTSNAKQINLVDALEALATAAGINIYVQQQNNS